MTIEKRIEKIRAIRKYKKIIEAAEEKIIDALSEEALDCGDALLDSLQGVHAVLNSAHGAIK